MRIPLDTGKTIDTETDLIAAERHILQKLFGWKAMVTSLSQFKEKTALALKDGWNNSGPIQKSPALGQIVQQLEKELLVRLKKEKE